MSQEPEFTDAELRYFQTGLESDLVTPKELKALGEKVVRKCELNHEWRDELIGGMVEALTDMDPTSDHATRLQRLIDSLRRKT